MSEYTIKKCRICGKLMKRYPYMVYKGDESCCSECNKEVDKEDEKTLDNKKLCYKLEK